MSRRRQPEDPRAAEHGSGGSPTRSRLQSQNVVDRPISRRRRARRGRACAPGRGRRGRQRACGRRARGPARDLQLVAVRRPEDLQGLQEGVSRARRSRRRTTPSNDELLAKLQAGGSGYDIVVPSQNAVAELIELKKLMKLDKSLMPNYTKNIATAWRKRAYDPTDDYSIVKDYGITMFFYRNDIVKEHPKTMLDFYNLLPKYGKKGRTSIMEGAEEVVPLALMALGIDPNTDKLGRPQKAEKFLLSIRSGVTTITSSNYINDGVGREDHPRPGLERRRAPDRAARKKKGDITVVVPHGMSEKLGGQLVHPQNASHPKAAHAWINFICDPHIAAQEMRYHNYAIPNAKALALMPASVRQDPIFNVPASSRTLPVRPEPEPRHREQADEDLHGVQVRLMAIVGAAAEKTGGRRPAARSSSRATRPG